MTQMAEPMVSEIAGAVFPEAPGEIYLKGSDVIAMARANAKLYDDLIAQQDDTDKGLLKQASLVGASEVLRVIGDELELLCLEMATDADEIIRKREAESG